MLFILSYGDFRAQRPRGIAVFLINNIGNTASVSGFQCSNLSTLTFIIKRILIIWIHAAVSVINKSTGMTMGSAVDFSFDDNKKLKKIIISLCHRQNYRRFNPFSQKLISEISSSAVNGTHFIVSSHWKIPRKSGKSKKVVPFSRLEFPNGISCSIYVSRSLYQFQVHGRAPPRTGVYDQMEQLFTNRKFHFCYLRNFRVFFLNGKRPKLHTQPILFCFRLFSHATK